MDNYIVIVIVLAILLMCLMILNHVTIIKSTNQGNCSQTTYGCCPDGINSKINFGGKNCPIYNPGPGYFPPNTSPAGPGGPLVPGTGGLSPAGPGGPLVSGTGGPSPEGPGGPLVSGTGGPSPAGPGGPLVSGPNTPPPGPGPKQSGNCIGSTYGCCPNTQTPRINQTGSNC